MMIALAFSLLSAKPFEKELIQPHLFFFRGAMALPRPDISKNPQIILPASERMAPFLASTRPLPFSGCHPIEAALRPQDFNWSVLNEFVRETHPLHAYVREVMVIEKFEDSAAQSTLPDVLLHNDHFPDGPGTIRQFGVQRLHKATIDDTA